RGVGAMPAPPSPDWAPPPPPLPAPEARPRPARRVGRTGPWDGPGSAVDAAGALRQVCGDGVEAATELGRLRLVEVVAGGGDLRHGLVGQDPGRLVDAGIGLAGLGTRDVEVV